jgi:hypothetical protein
MCLKTLQKYPSVDIHVLLALADEISGDSYKATEFVLPMDKVEEEPPVSSVMNVINSAWNSLLKF